MLAGDRTRRLSVATLATLLLLLLAVFSVSSERGFTFGKKPRGDPNMFGNPMYGGNEQNTFTAADPGWTRGDLMRLKQVWRWMADGPVTGQPVVAGGRVYFGSWSGTLYALDVANGRLIWQRHLGSVHHPAYGWDRLGIAGSPLLDGSRLIVADATGWVYALDPQNGRTLWQTKIGDPERPDMIWSSPHAYRGLVYLGIGGVQDEPGERGRVVALDEETGEVRWSLDLVRDSGAGASVFPTAAISPVLDRIFVATGNPIPYPENPLAPGPVPPGPDLYTDSVLALHAATGQIAWYYQTHPHDPRDYDFIASVNLFPWQDRLAAGAGEKDGVYYAFDAENGSPLWKADLSQPGFTTLILGTAAFAQGRLFVGTMDVPRSATRWPGEGGAGSGGRLVALSASDGSVLWSASMPTAVLGSPLLAGPFVYVADASGDVCAFEAASGSLVICRHVAAYLWKAAPAVASDTLLVPVTRPGGLVAFRPQR